MSFSEKEFLYQMGWDDFFESHASALNLDGLFPARVICEERNLYRVQAGPGMIFWAAVSGKMQYESITRSDFPAVGDWVLAEHSKGADRGIIHQVLPRKTKIFRKQVGSSADIQILSTNVDTIFITTSVNEDLNFRRIERYLAVAWESGSQPVILLTKADLCEDIHEVASEVESNFPGVFVHALSQEAFTDAHFLAEYLKVGTTSVFIGSSGVGKSTLVNFLIGANDGSVIKTQGIREDDGKGRHTTTNRHLYESIFGGLVIDTPGMRELQLSDHAEGLSTQFADIEQFAKRCRFSDCRHDTEPGCAIKQALETEELSEARWHSYQKLEAEIRFGLRKQSKAVASEERKAWKRIKADVRERVRIKKWGKL